MSATLGVPPTAAARRDAVLDAALGFAPADGWTPAMLARAGASMREDEAALAVLFPAGISDLLSLYSERLDAAMTERLAGAPLSVLRIRERIKLGVRARIEAIAPDIEAGRRAAALFLLPSYAPLGLKLAFRTVDVLWRLIGDRSTDFNFYTKRGLATGVYLATLMAWFRDTSPDKAEAWAVLNRRVDDVMTIEGAKLQLRKFTAMLPKPWAVLGALRYPESAAPEAEPPATSESRGRPFSG